ncbi:universal stress protein [Alkalihalobacillus oceani]|nr:universal stress protein [Halalkalibacter oceani]MCM3759793.1 universal stress protein [Halalkalibacter oceani]
MFKRILVPADGSDHSCRAVEYAADLAKTFSAEMIILYVVDDTTAKTDVVAANSKDEVDKKRKEKLAPVTELIERTGVAYNTRVIHGEPGPAIVKFANDGKYDCLVVGSRGLNRLQTMVLGSVSHKVVKRANMPVLIVK